MTGEGVVWGTWRTDLKEFSGSGFEGTFAEIIDTSAEVFGTGTAAGRGYRELEGWLLRSTLTEVYPGYVVETGSAFRPA